MRGLKSKRVLITGGASGIGAATADRFLEEGAQVSILDRDAKACEAIRLQLPKLSAAIIADVTSLTQVEAAFAQAVRAMGAVDVLINNAGISIRHNFLEITPEEWDKVIAVNLTGVFYVAQTAARHMWKRFSAEPGSGVILQTASTNGVVGQPYYADYNATKAGVIELTKTMALELAPKIRVCAVAPGYVLTPMQRAEYTDAMLEEVNQKIPLRRHAKPEDSPAPSRKTRRDRSPLRIPSVGRRSLRHRPRLHPGRRRNRRRFGEPLAESHKNGITEIKKGCHSEPGAKPGEEPAVPPSSDARLGRTPLSVDFDCES